MSVLLVKHLNRSSVYRPSVCRPNVRAPDFRWVFSGCSSFFPQEKLTGQDRMTGAHIKGGGGWHPMFCEIYLKSRSRNLNVAQKSVRLKSERHYHFVSIKRNRWTFWKWKLHKNNKNTYTNQEINHNILAANNQFPCCNSSVNVMRSDYLKPPRCSQNAHC